MTTSDIQLWRYRNRLRELLVRQGDNGNRYLLEQAQQRVLEAEIRTLEGLLNLTPEQLTDIRRAEGLTWE